MVLMIRSVNQSAKVPSMYVHSLVSLPVLLPTASELILEWVGEARPEGPRAGDGVLGEGTASPPHQLCGSTVSSLSGVQGRAPAAKTNNIDVVNYCRMQFNFELPSVTIVQCSKKFADKYRLCDDALCKSVICILLICADDVLYFVIFFCF